MKRRTGNGEGENREEEEGISDELNQGGKEDTCVHACVRWNPPPQLPASVCFYLFFCLFCLVWSVMAWQEDGLCCVAPRAATLWYGYMLAGREWNG